MDLEDEKVKKILAFINGDIRFRGMSIEDAEKLAHFILEKWKGDFANFLENMQFDAKLLISKLFGKQG